MGMKEFEKKGGEIVEIVKKVYELLDTLKEGERVECEATDIEVCEGSFFRAFVKGKVQPLVEIETDLGERKLIAPRPSEMCRILLSLYYEALISERKKVE